MSAIIKSTVSSELVLVFPSAKDCRLTGLTEERINELQSLIQVRYVNKCPTKTLMIYACPTRSLREYSQDNRKYGFVNLPADELRMRDQEFGGPNEIEEVNVEGDHEQDINEMFNQSILDPAGSGVNRRS